MGKDPYNYFEFPVKGFWRRLWAFVTRQKPKRYYFYIDVDDNNYPW
jgi:hypothetical protein